jgi:hypothetical protein
MIFQKVLKGMVGVNEAGAGTIFNDAGITCNWWRQVNPLPTNQIPGRLTEDNVLRHLSHYDRTDPATGRTFGELTPFISTTAGAVERDAYFGMNYVHGAFMTALRFATDNFRKTGAIFYGYVMVLGKKALPHEEFAEETRELNLFHAYQPFHPEGEIVAKISIPVPRLEKAEGYGGPAARLDWRDGRWPQPSWVLPNPRYAPVEEFSNVREAIL